MRFRSLFFVIAARFLFHALFIPAFEGPDEPFHLAHVTAVWRSEAVERAVVAAVQSVPCSADLHRAVGCRPFGQRAAAAVIAKPIANYEAHQPPLFYAAAHLIAHGDPITRLFLVRLFCAALTIVGARIAAPFAGCG